MMSRSLFAAVLATVAFAATSVQAQDMYYPGVDQPPAGGSRFTFGPALIHSGSSPGAYAAPEQFNGWNADAKPPMVLGAPTTAVPRMSGFRGLFQNLLPAPTTTPQPSRSHWHSNRCGY